MKRKILLFPVLLLGLVTLILAAEWLYYEKSASLTVQGADAAGTYSRYCLFVSGDDSEMWQQIYAAAQESGKETDMLVDWTGRETPAGYTPAQCVEIGIASGADAMIVCPDGTADMAEAIAQASAAGIPVVTLQQDARDSGRVCYVGVSGYQLGSLYGEAVTSLLTGEDTTVCLLVDDAQEEVTANLIYAQIAEAIRSFEGAGQVELISRRVDTSGSFEAEETIRNLLIGEKVPDILICVNPVQTECSLAAMIEYNLVSELSIIGYYASDTVLSAIRQELMPVAITVDPVTCGRQAVSALKEYFASGNVSDYLNVPADTVTDDNVFLYLRRAAARKSETAAQGT